MTAARYASRYEIREDPDADDFPLDEVIAHRPDAVHLERLTRNAWWVGITMPDGTIIEVDIGTRPGQDTPIVHVEVTP